MSNSFWPHSWLFIPQKCPSDNSPCWLYAACRASRADSSVFSSSYPSTTSICPTEPLCHYCSCPIKCVVNQISIETLWTSHKISECKCRTWSLEFGVTVLNTHFSQRIVNLLLFAVLNLKGCLGDVQTLWFAKFLRFDGHMQSTLCTSAVMDSKDLPHNSCLFLYQQRLVFVLTWYIAFRHKLLPRHAK